jgi:hypothetical protein
LKLRSTNRDEGATSTRRSIPPEGHSAENFEARLFRLLSTRRQEQERHGFRPCRLQRHSTNGDEGAAIEGGGSIALCTREPFRREFEATCSAYYPSSARTGGHGFQPCHLASCSTNRDEGAATAHEQPILLRASLFALSMLRVHRLFGCAHGRLCHVSQGHVAILPTQLFSLYGNPVAHAFVVPALRKLREERGTHGVSYDGESKSWGHTPVCQIAIKKRQLQKIGHSWPPTQKSYATRQDCAVRVIVRPCRNVHSRI